MDNEFYNLNDNFESNQIKRMLDSKADRLIDECEIDYWDNFLDKVVDAVKMGDYPDIVQHKKSEILDLMKNEFHHNMVPHFVNKSHSRQELNNWIDKYLEELDLEISLDCSIKLFLERTP